MTNIYLAVAVLIGMAFACQPAINSVAAKVLGSPWPATALSVAITLVASLAVMAVTRTTPTLEMMGGLPWWIIIGVLVVGGGVAIVPVTGVALFFVCMIAGQLLGSVLLDHIGAFGLPVREVSMPRIAGICLTFAGVFFVRFG